VLQFSVHTLEHLWVFLQHKQKKKSVSCRSIFHKVFSCFFRLVSRFVCCLFFCFGSTDLLPVFAVSCKCCFFLHNPWSMQCTSHTFCQYCCLQTTIQIFFAFPDHKFFFFSIFHIYIQEILTPNKITLCVR
jgi:hypothetical protein